MAYNSAIGNFDVSLTHMTGMYVLYVCMYVNVCMYICMYVRTCMYGCMYICTCMCM